MRDVVDFDQASLGLQLDHLYLVLLTIQTRVIQGARAYSKCDFFAFLLRVFKSKGIERHIRFIDMHALVICTFVLGVIRNVLMHVFIEVLWLNLIMVLHRFNGCKVCAVFLNWLCNHLVIDCAFFNIGSLCVDADGGVTLLTYYWRVVGQLVQTLSSLLLIILVTWLGQHLLSKVIIQIW